MLYRAAPNIDRSFAGIGGLCFSLAMFAAKLLLQRLGAGLRPPASEGDVSFANGR